MPPPRSTSPIPTPPRSSRARWLVPLAVLVVFVAFSAGLALLLIGASLSGDSVAEGSILEIKLSGNLKDAPEAFSILPGLSGPPSLFELRQALGRAAKDSHITAVRVDVERLENGWGGGEELVDALDSFRRTRKPVHVFFRGDMVGDLDYMPALAADRVWVTPEGSFLINGLRAEVEFWRGTLDKLHVVPQYFMMKEYKSYGEPMTRHEMSPQSREETTALIRDIWERFVGRVAERRKIDIAAVRRAADLGIMTAAEAESQHLVDRLGYDEEIREELGRTASGGTYHGISVRRYLDRTSHEDALSRRRKVAAVFAEGVIVASAEGGPFDDLVHGPAVASVIRKAANDDSIRAILLRVNSPGGSPVGSDFVARAVEYARRTCNKPVVVSMSAVAASGGYWVAMDADGIVAQPSTITGLIGVVFGKLNLLGLYELAGAGVDSVQVTPRADLLSAVHSFDDGETERIWQWMGSAYSDFVNRVAKGRRMTAKDVEEVARGRVWTGADAKQRGLVDRLGGYDEALRMIKEKARIPDGEEVDLVVYQGKRSLLDLLLTEDGRSEVAVLVRAALGGGNPLDPRAALSAGLRELARPGAWLLAPTLTIR